MDRLLRRIVHKAMALLSDDHRDGSSDALSMSIDHEYFRLKLLAAGINPTMPDLIDFYKCNAAARALSPNPWFDEIFYQSKNPDVLSAVQTGAFLSGFDHFIHHGIREGRVPNPTFHQQIIDHAANKEVSDSSKFDATFYLLNHEHARQFMKSIPIISPLEFFNLYGRRMGHASCAQKRKEINNVVYAGMQQLINSVNYDSIFKEFNAEFYQEKYGCELGDMSPYAHYIHVGRKKGYSPSSEFDEMFYRTFYTDIGHAVASGTLSSGFEHYLMTGRKEGRLPKFELTNCLDKALPGLTQPIALTNFVELERKLKPHNHKLVEGQPRKIWFFVPRMNPDIFFGGYVTLIRLAEAFLRQGASIGFFIFDDTAESFDYYCHRCPDCELARHRMEIAIFSSFNKSPFPLGSDDIIIAYSAWQAFAASHYAEYLKSKKFVFLIQEYEAIFHSYDSARFIVDMAYRKPHIALFNSECLERFFRQQKLGVFAHDKHASNYMTFEHVLTAVTAPLPEILLKRKTRRVVVYTRPEAHAQRNLTEICIIALRKAIAKGIFSQDYEFIGIGALSGPHDIDLGWGRKLKICTKVDRESYINLLQGADIGMSLMYAPHPSLMPFELANAGAIVVTNTFSNRGHKDIQARSLRLVPVDLSIDDIVAGLKTAVHMTDDIDLRTNPSFAIHSPTSWSQVFDENFVENLLSRLSVDVTAKNQLRTARRARYFKMADSA